MASVPVIISGVLWDDADKSGKKVTLFGEASIAGLGVGGGPIMPPLGGGGLPPGIWPGPGPLPHPEHPIVLPPENPGEEPQWALKPVWVPSVGWVTVIVPVGDQPLPTPSKK